MQTEEQVLQKVDVLVNDKLISDIKEDIQKVLKSGAINLDDFYDDYLLPKFLVAAVLEKQMRNFEPPKNNRGWRKQYLNIKKFV